MKNSLKICTTFVLLFAFILIGKKIIDVNAADKNQYLKTAQELQSLIEEQKEAVETIMNYDIEKLDKSKTLSDAKSEVYLDQSNNMVMYAENKIIGFLQADDQQSISSLQEFTEEEIKLIADSCLFSLTDSKEYKLAQLFYDDVIECYKVIYYYYINGYRTTDVVYLNISKTGELLGWTMPNEGKFEGYKIKKIEEKTLKEEAVQLISKKYEGYEINCDSIMIDCINNTIKYQIVFICTDPDTNFSNSETVYIDAEEG